MKLEEMRDYNAYIYNFNGYKVHYKETDEFVSWIKNNNNKCLELMKSIINKYFGTFYIENTYEFEFCRFGKGCCECCNVHGYKIIIKKPQNAADVFLDIFLNKNTIYEKELNIIKNFRGLLVLKNFDDRIELIIG